MNISNKNFSSIEQITGQYLNKTIAPNNLSKESVKSFNDILKQRSIEDSSTELKFSKHANERLASRNINLSTEQIERLECGVFKAQEKGIKESLVMLDNLAFIVNVKNNTVITAVNPEEGVQSIFTNIDGAIII